MSRETAHPISRRERRAQERLDRPASPRHRSKRRAERPKWQSPVVLVSAAAVLIGIAVIAFARPATSSGGDLVTPPTSYAAGLADGEVLGASTAPVVIQLYSDFQCPACKSFVQNLLPQLVREFVVPGTVRIEARDIDILGRASPNESLELAAGARCAAAQNRYWVFHDIVFWNQGRENAGDHSAAFIASVADAAGVDRSAWDACFAKSETRDPIVAATTAARVAGISSTPTLVVNGQSVIGVPKYEDLAALIRKLASPAPSSAAPS